MKRLYLCAVLLAWWIGMMWSVARAQEMPPIDRELWQAMSQAFGNISMPLAAHQQIQQIMQGVEQQAMQRKAQRDAAGEKAKQEPKQ
jgi:uncharacterized protein YneF (UPF0154 family)